MSITLTIGAEGQVTLENQILAHLGIHPGGMIELELLPDRTIVIRAAAATFADACGMLAGMTDKVAALEEINETIRAGWAGETKP